MGSILARVECSRTALASRKSAAAWQSSAAQPYLSTPCSSGWNSCIHHDDSPSLSYCPCQGQQPRTELVVNSEAGNDSAATLSAESFMRRVRGLLVACTLSLSTTQPTPPPSTARCAAAG
eukprot:1032097-Rhodomonas_salina.8